MTVPPLLVTTELLEFCVGVGIADFRGSGATVAGVPSRYVSTATIAITMAAIADNARQLISLKAITPPVGKVDVYSLDHTFLRRLQAFPGKRPTAACLQIRLKRICLGFVIEHEVGLDVPRLVFVRVD